MLTRDEFENLCAVVCVNIETTEDNQGRAYNMFSNHDAEQRAEIERLKARVNTYYERSAKWWNPLSLFGRFYETLERKGEQR